MNRAAIDIGSNSILLLVVDENGTVLFDTSTVVGLGKGLGEDGNFADDRMRLARLTLSRYAQEARALGVEPSRVRIAATSAARRARNVEHFIAQVRNESGLNIRVISGEREAELTWAGSRMDLDLPETGLGVVDLGGGSTEIVLGDPGGIHLRYSMEIGTVRLTETVCGSPPDTFLPNHRDQMIRIAEEVVTAAPWRSHPQVLVAVAGTATTLAAAEIGLRTWDAHRVHGFWLSRDALASWMHRLVGCTRAQRKQWFRVSPERADTVLAGACILARVCESARVPGLRISVGGIRHGLVSAETNEST